MGAELQLPLATTSRLVGPGESFNARAIFVGERIDTRALEPRIGERPVITSLRGGGWAAVFRFGAIVFFAAHEPARRELMTRLAPGIQGRFDEPERELLEVQVDASARDGVEGGAIIVSEASPERLQVIAEALAKSVVLAHYEETVAEVFDKIEPMAARLMKTGRIGRRGRDLVRQIGETLLIQHRTIGRVEVMEKPEILWERPDLERLYLRLEDELELRERHLALEQKITLVANTNETLLEMLQTRRSLRVEWYIVALIVVEIGLSLYGMFGAH